MRDDFREPSITLPRCARCGEVIGVYEPMVLVDDDTVRVTSRAAEPSASAPGRVGYHVDCHVPEAVDVPTSASG